MKGNNDIIDFGPIKDTTKDIIKVVGVGGGGCNAVANMYREGMDSVRFAVCNTDSKSLSANPVPIKILLGKSGLGAGADPEKGRQEAEENIDDIKRTLTDCPHYHLQHIDTFNHILWHILIINKLYLIQQKKVLMIV